MFKKLKNLLSIYYSIIRRFLGYKYPINVIPEGLYCYTWIEEVYVICPYFKRIDENHVGCKYLGIISDDLVFNDQCKICNKNLNYISMLDTNILIGSKVHYTSQDGSKVENGILKSINDDKTIAFIVFNCNGDGKVFKPLSNSSSSICTTCNGLKIISELTGLPLILNLYLI